MSTHVIQNRLDEHYLQTDIENAEVAILDLHHIIGRFYLQVLKEFTFRFNKYLPCCNSED